MYFYQHKLKPTTMNQTEIKSIVKEILTECEELLTKKMPQYEIKIEETERTQKVIINYEGGDYYFTMLKSEKKEKLVSYALDTYSYVTKQLPKLW